MEALMKRKMPVVARTLLGLIFTVFGLNGFFQFIPQPPSPDAAQAFAGALAASGYFFPLLKSIEVASGILLLSGRFVPLALTVLAPIVVNIFAFHLFLAPGGMPMAVLLVALELGLAWAYRDSFRSVLALNAKPRSDESPSASLGGEAVSRA
jgi:uncharacterized membrane protein YphA (DoxX/SURF4 family)